MPIQVELAGWKKVYKDGLPSYWQKRIEAGLTFPNPVYESMKKYRPNTQETTQSLDSEADCYINERC